MTKQEIVDHLFSYGWPKDEELAEYAVNRHGYGGDNASYGITYPGDLDDYDRAMGDNIPDGMIEVYGLYFEEGELLVEESYYLERLKTHLSTNQRSDLVTRVEEAEQPK